MVWGKAIYRIRSPSELLDFDLHSRENGKIQKYEDDPRKKRKEKPRERKSKTSENLKKKGKKMEMEKILTEKKSGHVTSGSTVALRHNGPRI